MNRIADELPRLAAEGRLYPSVIISGGTADDRLGLAFEIGRALLCERALQERPCGECRHCRRIARGCCLTPVTRADAVSQDPAKRKCRHCGKNYLEHIHPDFIVLSRRPKANQLRALEPVIKKDRVREAVHAVQMSPYEARGQVVVVTEAQTLHYEAPDILLKTLEEPVGTTPRHFLLLAASAQELLPTLRSRSLTVYLGAGDADVTPDDEQTTDLVEHWRRRQGDASSALWTAGLTDRLVAIGGKDLDDVRARRGWNRAARAVTEAAAALDDRDDRAAALALASDLLDAHRLRERYIQPRRIIEGLAARRLRRDRPETGFESSVNVLMGPP